MRALPVGSLLKFFSLTYAVTWTCFIAAAAVSGNGASAPPAQAGLRGLLFVVGTFAPAIVALWLTARADGRAGVIALLRRLIQWRVGARWYVFAVGYMGAIKLGVALVHRAATGAWPRFGHDAWYVILAGTIISTVVGGQAGEEIGWRALDSRGSVLLGPLWAAWHLPLFFIPGIIYTHSN